MEVFALFTVWETKSAFLMLFASGESILRNDSKYTCEQLVTIIKENTLGKYVMYVVAMLRFFWIFSF